MLVIDIVVVLVLVVATVLGVRRGLFASLGTLVGLAAGGLAAFWAVPLANDAIGSTAWRGAAVLAVAIALLAVGAALGSGVGALVRRGVDRMKLRRVERFLGGILSLVVGALAVSLVGQSIAATGMPVVSAAVSSSVALRQIDNLTPRLVTAALAQLRGAVLDEGLPRLGGLLGPVTLPTSPDIALDDPALDDAAQSVARVSGVAFACGQSATGSGFVVAPDRVVTNAHVVAGVDRPMVELPGRLASEGVIVYFDPVDDLAVVAADTGDAAPLQLARGLDAGSRAVVQGYPFGGPLTVVAAQVLSVGTAPVPDIYAEGSAPREVYALAAAVRPGNSGGPLLTTTGEAAGVVFARADSDEDVGYAMTMTELAPVVEGAAGLDEGVGSGSCTATR